MDNVNVKGFEVYQESESCRCFVHKAEVVFMHEYRVPDIGELCINDTGVVNIPSNKEDCTHSFRNFVNHPFKLLLISRTERSDVGDKCLYDLMSVVREVISDDEYWSSDFMSNDAEFRTRTNNNFCLFKVSTPQNNHFKILADHSNFSTKHIQAIVDGKIKNGDSVFVELDKKLTDVGAGEMEMMDRAGDAYPKVTPTRWNDYQVKLNNNFIKLFPNNPEVVALERAVAYSQSSCVDDSKGTPALLLGDVAELIKILTGKEVNVKELYTKPLQ